MAGDTSNNPLRYQYWTRNMTDLLPVALYGFRILGVGQPGDYAEMPPAPGDCIEWDFSERARAALEARREQYAVYNSETHYSAEWMPHTYTLHGPDVFPQMAAEMRHYLTVHEQDNPRSYDRLNVKVDYGDFVEWVDIVEQEEARVHDMPMDVFLGALQFLVWLQDRKRGRIVILNPNGTQTPVAADAGMMQLAQEWVEYEREKAEWEADEANAGAGMAFNFNLPRGEIPVDQELDMPAPRPTEG